MFDFFRKKKKEKELIEETYEDIPEEGYKQEGYSGEYDIDDASQEILSTEDLSGENISKDSEQIIFESDLNSPNEDYSQTYEEVEEKSLLEENISNENPVSEVVNDELDAVSDDNIFLEEDMSKEDILDDSLDKVDDFEETETSGGQEKPGFFERIKTGLVKTRDQFTSQVKNLFTANVKIDDELFEELEEILISADIGMNSTLEIVDSLRDEIKARKIKDSEQIYPLLKEIMTDKLDRDNLNNDLNIVDNQLAIILVIGVNGVGKTTTIGKLAYNLQNEGKNVMLAAADTFRAAAIDQLGEWADRADVEMIAHHEGADPSAVIFDAIQSAKSKNVDVLICDTAGRLHNKKNLMKELEKINKTIDSHAGKATRENLLVLDATTGQNAVSQLREFKNVTDISGLVLTKLDGTAKGGIIYPLEVELSVPVKYIGLGEGIDNLEKFDSQTFVEALF